MRYGSDRVSIESKKPGCPYPTFPKGGEEINYLSSYNIYYNW
jgi:hypothetical protein